MKDLDKYKAEWNTALRRTKVDKAIGFFSPAAERARIVSRLQTVKLRFDAAQPSRARGRALPSIKPDSKTAHYERVVLREEARSLAENAPICDTILNNYCTYLASTVTLNSRHPDRAKAKAINKAFNKWARTASYDGQNSLTSLIQLLIRAEKVDGDCALLFVSTSKGLKVQVIEADQIGDNSTDGIVQDETGEVVGYMVNGQIITRDQVLFYYTPKRAGLRGFSAFHACVNTIKDLQKTLEYTLLRIKYSATIAALVKNGSGSEDLDSILNGTGTSEPVTPEDETTDWGQIKYLSADGDITAFESEFPKDTVQKFVKTLQQSICNSLEISEIFCISPELFASSGVRFLANSQQRIFEKNQVNLQEKVLIPLGNRILKYLAANNLIEGVSKDDPELLSFEFKFPVKVSIDFRYEIDGTIKLIENGLMSKEEWFLENGYENAQEEMEKIKREKNLNEQNNI